MQQKKGKNVQFVDAEMSFGSMRQTLGPTQTWPSALLTLCLKQGKQRPGARSEVRERRRCRREEPVPADPNPRAPRLRRRLPAPRGSTRVCRGDTKGRCGLGRIRSQTCSRDPKGTPGETALGHGAAHAGSPAAEPLQRLAREAAVPQMMVPPLRTSQGTGPRFRFSSDII